MWARSAVSRRDACRAPDELIERRIDLATEAVDCPQSIGLLGIAFQRSRSEVPKSHLKEP